VVGPVPVVQREDEGLAELLEEVAMLRRAGEYQAAVERLRAGDRKGWSSRGRQLVSYEIGSLLERQLGDREGACAHWAGHRKRWPKGRYEAIVGRSMVRLECELLREFPARE
jgi:transmembrane sensor